MHAPCIPDALYVDRLILQIFTLGAKCSVGMARCTKLFLLPIKLPTPRCTPQALRCAHSFPSLHIPGESLGFRLLPTDVKILRSPPLLSFLANFYQGWRMVFAGCNAPCRGRLPSYRGRLSSCRGTFHFHRGALMGTIKHSLSHGDQSRRRFT